MMVEPPEDDESPRVILKTGASRHDPASRDLTAAAGPCAPDTAAWSRRLPVGAEVTAHGVSFRVWAPERRHVEVVLADSLGMLTPIALERDANGYFSGIVETARAGDLYWYRLDAGGDLLPDPASRFQPEGPMGPSEVVDPDVFIWTDDAWPGVTWKDNVLYEMHVGTFTKQGTWRSAIAQLPDLAELGVTIIEMMPVADFVGQFGWGYDCVDLFAPTRLYGGPDDLRAFIDAAHRLRLGVILDVVYNHVGPSGNFLPRFSKRYFSKRHATEWGDAINFDDAGCEPVREFFIANAAYWIREFHFDGLRIDATQNIYDLDPSHEHILAAITHAAREAAGKRSVFIVAENEPQDIRLVKSPRDGGYGMDAMWNDDLHHTAVVALTGRKEAYYTDYRGTPQEFVSAAKYGFLYQGQRYKWQNKPRGTPTFGIHPERFVTFIQNHDQIANSGLGLRINELAGPPRCRAMTAYLLLAPETPMLFMGQEFAASSPFLYFADNDRQLADLVDAGRKEFMQQFRSLATPEMQDAFPRPDDPETFERCKLDFSERETHAGIYELHRDLLRLRRTDPVLRMRRPGAVDGAVLGAGAFVLRFFGDGDDRLLLMNLDVELHLDPAPEPLLAPPQGHTWGILWSSEDPRYGGTGTPPVYTEENWRLPGRIAIVLQPEPIEEQAGTRKSEPKSEKRD
jgi:maltooligosyltrehalose trehalohydrolase